MSEIFLALQKVHETVHDFKHQIYPELLPKKPFSKPAIYTGGISYSGGYLSVAKQKVALKRDWYVYYSFRDKESGKLKRMPNIKAGVNRFKTFEERWNHLKVIRDALQLLLDRGGDPNGENDIDMLLGLKPLPTKRIIRKEKIINSPATKVDSSNDPVKITIEAAIDFALNIKKNSIAENSYRNFELRIRKFRLSFDGTKPISDISRQSVNTYLNRVLENSSARNRNNTRTDLSSLFQVLENNEIIPENFVKKINVLNSNPERNKTFTPHLQNDIFKYLEFEDPLLDILFSLQCVQLYLIKKSCIGKVPLMPYEK